MEEDTMDYHPCGQVETEILTKPESVSLSYFEQKKLT